MVYRQVWIFLNYSIQNEKYLLAKWEQINSTTINIAWMYLNARHNTKYKAQAGDGRGSIVYLYLEPSNRITKSIPPCATSSQPLTSSLQYLRSLTRNHQKWMSQWFDYQRHFSCVCLLNKFHQLRNCVVNKQQKRSFTTIINIWILRCLLLWNL